MTGDGLIEDLSEMAGQLTDRVIIGFLLTVLAYIQLYLLSNSPAATRQGPVQVIGWVYEVFAAFLLVYMALPVFYFGIEWRHQRIGKAAIVAVCVVVVSGVVLT